MTYETDQAFRAALEARIRDAQDDAAGVSRVRKRIVLERFIARLPAQAPGDWVLKGGFALELRLGNVARSTKDADFEWRLAEEDAVEMLLDAAALELADRFTFALERADEDTDPPRGGQRWRVTATVAGRIFERTVIDVAFVASPIHVPDEISTSNLLDFASIERVEVSRTRRSSRRSPWSSAGAANTPCLRRCRNRPRSGRRRGAASLGTFPPPPT